MTVSCSDRPNISPLQSLVSELEQHQNPTLVYDLAGIKYELDLLESHLKDAVGERLSFTVFFSVKANSNPELLRWLSQQGVGLEVSSIPEFETAQASGAELISATSPGLSATDIGYLCRQGVEVNIDNPSQLDGVPYGSKIGLRLCMPLEFVSEAQQKTYSRFGVDLENPSLHESLRASGCDVVRVHGHFRDISNAEQLECLARRVVAAAKILPHVETINLGGGMTRLYEGPLAAKEAWQCCASIFADLRSGTRVLVEPGAQLLTGHGYLGTRVLSVTPRPDGRQLVVIDSSKWNLVCWSKYELVHPEPGEEGVITDVVGPTCYENDVWVSGVRLAGIRPGQQLVFRGLGAYVASMARRMHGLKVPREVLL